MEGESNSIQNQRELLTKYAQDHGYTNLKNSGPSTTAWTASAGTERALPRSATCSTSGIRAILPRKSVSACISAAPAASISASRPTATAATRTTRTSGFWMRKPRRLSSASLISASTAKARSRFPGFLSAIRFSQPRLYASRKGKNRCPRIRMDGRINPSSGFWNGRNTPAAPVTSRPTPSPTS